MSREEIPSSPLPPAPAREGPGFPPEGGPGGVPSPESPSGMYRAYTRGRRVVWGITRLSLGVGLLIYVAASGRFKLDEMEGTWGRWWGLLLGVACQIPILFIATVRWRIALRAQEAPIRYWQAFRINLIGCFFANFLPGGVTAGADVVRGYYVARVSPRGRRGEAVATILTDRLLGFAALTCLMIVALALNASWLRSLSRDLPGDATVGAGGADAASGYHINLFLTAVLIVAGMVLTLVVLTVLAILGARRGARLSPPDGGGSTAARFMARLGGALVLYRRSRGKLIFAAAISIGDHIFSILSAVCFALAIGVKGVSFLQYFVLIPLGMLGNVVPLGPQGLGTYQFVQGEVFQAAGLSLEHGTWVALLWMLSRMLVGMAGVVPYVQGQRKLRAESGGPAEEKR